MVVSAVQRSGCGSRFGGNVSLAKYGCGMRSARSLTGRGVPSDIASSEYISIWAFSKRCGFFSAGKVSSGGQPIWG